MYYYNLVLITHCFDVTNFNTHELILGSKVFVFSCLQMYSNIYIYSPVII